MQSRAYVVITGPGTPPPSSHAANERRDDRGGLSFFVRPAARGIVVDPDRTAAARDLSCMRPARRGQRRRGHCSIAPPNNVHNAVGRTRHIDLLAPTTATTTRPSAPPAELTAVIDIYCPKHGH